jgi:transposase
LKSKGYLAPAWLGLVLSQYCSGGETRPGRITKAGDEYLRSLLVMGGRAVLSAQPI